MANYTAKHIKDMEAGFGGGFVKARAELGVTSFGMQVLRIPAGNDAHPEHDHQHDGQEEVYVALKGSATLDIEGDSVELDTGMLVRVGPDVKRKLRPGPDGVEVLVIGGCPGSAYEIWAPTELSAG